MIPSRHLLTLPEQERSILRVLLYFDIFQYPLTKEEISRFAPATLSSDWETSLMALCTKEWVTCLDGLYSIDHNPFNVARRKAGNRLAEKRIIVAQRISSVVSRLPFVRAILLSGSISKGYMDSKSDIDYFIITSPGRLWIVRTTLALARRLFLFNSHKYFCTNYFIDEYNIEITEKNIFTAIETCTLLPMFGKEVVDRFDRSNQWSKQFLPNCNRFNNLSQRTDGWLKRFLETLLPSAWLDRLDHWLMNQSTGYWKRKYHNLLNQQDFAIAFQSSRSVSRSHPEFYQKRVIALYMSKINAFEAQWGVSLDL
jgi:hypothetical protein